jgi:two-component sensor histidine kinase
LNLVRLLGEHQLNGQIEIEHHEGTTFKVRFAPGRFDR